MQTAIAQNPVRLAEPVFYSIQGEGIHAGVPSIFVRLQGCGPSKAGCSFCDTPYAKPMDGGFNTDLDSILFEIRNFGPVSRICITGGEPLAQDIKDLVRMLKRQSYKVDIETNGCMPKPEWYSIVDCWIADMKCPSSGMDIWSREKDWYTQGSSFDQIKFVVGTEEDLSYAERLISRNITANPWVLISPVLRSGVIEKDGYEWDCLKDYQHEKEWLQRVVEFTKEIRVVSDKVRFSLQIHKYIWTRTKRGV